MRFFSIITVALIPVIMSSGCQQNSGSTTSPAPDVIAPPTESAESKTETATPVQEKAADEKLSGIQKPFGLPPSVGPMVRFASFNCSLTRGEAGKLISDLKGGRNVQAQKIARIIQKVQPDVLLINEFDYDESGVALKSFREEYLAVGEGETKGIEYPYVFVAPVNTGVLSEIDMNKDDKIELPDDGFGFGRHPGQYGMVVLSRYEIDEPNVRTFQNFLWKDMPDAMLPKDEDGKPYYDEATTAKLRLSSKSHWDVPVNVEDALIHFLVSHPTPPVFDGPEDRNGCRNHDEIRFWAEYIKSPDAEWIVDDAGKKGGLAANSRFIIAGDLNADPNDGESTNSPAKLITENPMLSNPFQSSRGGPEQAKLQGGANDKHKGSAEHDTGDFADKTVGNLRVDYVMPSANQNVYATGVFWPASDEPDANLVDASDHRMVWADIGIKPQTP